MTVQVHAFRKKHLIFVHVHACTCNDKGQINSPHSGGKLNLTIKLQIIIHFSETYDPFI